MRQEMKVGFAIGGVLLAVLVVYVLVVSGHDKSNQVTLDTGDPGVNFTADHADKTAKVTGTTVDTGKAESGKIDTIKPTPPVTDLFQPSSAKPATQESSAVAVNTNDPWSKALSTGSVPTLMSQTPTAAGKMSRTDDATANLTQISTLDKVNGFAGARQSSGSRIDPLMKSDPERTDSDKPSTQPAATDAPRTHTVAAGETFSSISTAVYGSANFYPHILRANPTVDPKKLKVGTVLTIPPLEESKSDKTATISDTSNATLASADFTPKKPIDNKSQYVVQSGDSLYRISIKLYGKADHVDKLAEANKGELGAERRLKVGQVLALPEAPTATR